RRPAGCAVRAHRARGRIAGLLVGARARRAPVVARPARIRRTGELAGATRRPIARPRLHRLMDTFIHGIHWLVEALLRPFDGLVPWVSLAIIAIPTAAVILVVVRRTSPQKLVGTAR